ncbi:MAG TPA: SDR family oxidoreductase [Pseudonocardiaceae bacterium]|nr:SDR family oxidoreductase [Pseudonocardiaceae bacterium]
MEPTGRTALITGASAGLGAHFARLFAQDGHGLVLVARRRDKLDRLAAELGAARGVRTTVIAADLTDPKAPQHLHEELTQAGIEVEFLVNNAGFGASGRFADLDLSRQLDMIELNVTALTHLTGLFLPAMIRRRRGRVLNVSSSAGFLPGPYMATYYASKAYVLSFTEALAQELHGTGVTATALCPGATATEFAAAAEMGSAALFKGVMAAAPVARYGYRAMLAGKTVAVPGVTMKLALQSLRVSPRWLARRLAGRLNQPL